jgi:hypothetical protein
MKVLKKDETKELELCVWSILYGDVDLLKNVNLKEFKDSPTLEKQCYLCEGYNYNCPSYKTVREHYGIKKK